MFTCGLWVFTVLSVANIMSQTSHNYQLYGRLCTTCDNCVRTTACALLPDCLVGFPPFSWNLKKTPDVITRRYRQTTGGEFEAHTQVAAPRILSHCKYCHNWICISVCSCWITHSKHTFSRRGISSHSFISPTIITKITEGFCNGLSLPPCP